MHRTALAALVAAAVALVACPHEASAPAEAPLAYPATERAEVVDTYHGAQVADPYRWLEDSDSEATRAWVASQNALTQGWLGAVPQRAAIRERLEAAWNYERYSAPVKKGGHYLWYKNDGLQNQSVLYVSDALDGAGRVLLDPNTLSADGTVSLAGISVSEDGKLLAYGTSDGGSDWSTWRVMDIETGAARPDETRWIRNGGVSWAPDSGGWYYTRYPEPGPDGAADHDQTIWYHRLGDPQAADTLVYERKDHPDWTFGPGVTEDGRWLVVGIYTGTEPKNRVYLKDLTQPDVPITPLFDDYDAHYWYLGNVGARFFFMTDKDAPRERIIAVDLAKPAPADWVEVVPQSEHVIEDASVVGGKLVVTWLEDAHSVVKVFELDGTFVRDVELPGLGSSRGFQGRSDEAETFFSYTDYTTPGALYRYDVATGEASVWKQPKVAFDGSKYETTQVFVPSKDGTEVPVFLVHRKGLTLDGTHPTLLYGYGGFNVSLTPYFSAKQAMWLELGGVYAVANLRGGGEYGREWHEAGTQGRKQNVFDDFIAVSEWLIAQRYTSREKLAINGGSNGGLLVGACVTQRPDLYGAAIPQVGVLDMLRYHQFTIGWMWASDYGTSADPEQFAALYRYSPVHNTKPGTKYPPTLITTGDHDDRVVPAHSYKFAAALQAAQGGAAPILLRVETRAGHGAGKPTTIAIDEAADMYAFLVRTLGMEVAL